MAQGRDVEIFLFTTTYNHLLLSGETRMWSSILPLHSGKINVNTSWVAVKTQGSIWTILMYFWFLIEFIT
jgi:hypothetical protein